MFGLFRAALAPATAGTTLDGGLRPCWCWSIDTLGKWLPPSSSEVAGARWPHSSGPPATAAGNRAIRNMTACLHHAAIRLLAHQSRMS